MMKKTVLTKSAMILIALFSFGVIMSCNELDVDCDSLTNNFQVNGYFGFLAKGTDQLVLDNTSKNGYILRDSLVITTTVDSLMILLQSAVTPTVAINHETKGRFLASAFAACEIPPLNFTTNISNISIKSNAAFAAGFEPGKNLNSFFDIRQANEDVGFLSAQLPLVDFLARVNKAASLMVIRPNATPTLSKGHIFTITVLHTDGAIFEYKLPLVKFE
jgi:hypothetical protein